jgi:chromosome segregation ATPase
MSQKFKGGKPVTTDQCMFDDADDREAKTVERVSPGHVVASVRTARAAGKVLKAGNVKKLATKFEGAAALRAGSVSSEVGSIEELESQINRHERAIASINESMTRTAVHAGIAQVQVSRLPDDVQALEALAGDLATRMDALEARMQSAEDTAAAADKRLCDMEAAVAGLAEQAVEAAAARDNAHTGDVPAAASKDSDTASATSWCIVA